MPRLQVGYLTTSDSVDLADGVTTFIPASMIPAGGGVSLPGGVMPSEHPRGVFASASSQPQNTRTWTMTVGCTSPIVTSSYLTNAVEATWSSIEDKLEQARRAAGDSPNGTPVYFQHHMPGASEETFWQVVDGTFSHVPFPVPWGSPYKFGVLTLYVRPYGFGAPLSNTQAGPFVNGATASAVRRANVPGRVEAMQRVLFTDNSSGGVVIQRVRGSIKTGRPLPAGDWTPLYLWSAAGAGVSQADATATGGNRIRLVGATAAFQTMATVASAAGAHQNVKADAWAVLRDSSVPLSTPTWAALSAAVASGAGGNLLDGNYLALLTTHDGSGNESSPQGSQFAAVPITTNANIFFDGAEGGDFLLWDGTENTFQGSGNQANMSISTAASYPLDAPGNVLGFVATVGTGAVSGGVDLAQAIAYKAPPGGGTTGAIRYRLQIVSTSGQGAQCQIPLVVDATQTAQLYFFETNLGWNIAGLGGGSQPVIFGQGQWIQHVEVRVTAYNAGTKVATVTVLVNDVATVTAQAFTLTAAPASFAIGASVTATGLANMAMTAWFDDVQIAGSAVSNIIGANTGSIVYTWTPPSVGAGTGYNLYVQRNSGSWMKVPVTGTTYTLASNTAGTVVPAGPPLGAPAIQFAQFRLQYGVAGSAPLYQLTQPVSVILGGQWQLVRVASGIVLPPQAPGLGVAPAPWVVNLQAASGGTNTPNLDAALLWLTPCDEDGFEVTVPGAALATAAQWQLDIDPAGRVSCELYDVTGATRLQAATVSGQLRAGPADSIMSFVAEVSDGSGHFIVDMVNCKWTTQEIVTPQYQSPAGVR